jgi:hypothetical protein
MVAFLAGGKNSGIGCALWVDGRMQHAIGRPRVAR